MGKRWRRVPIDGQQEPDPALDRVSNTGAAPVAPRHPISGIGLGDRRTTGRCVTAVGGDVLNLCVYWWLRNHARPNQDPPAGTPAPRRETTFRLGGSDGDPTASSTPNPRPATRRHALDLAAALTRATCLGIAVRVARRHSSWPAALRRVLWTNRLERWINHATRCSRSEPISEKFVLQARLRPR
jgi:hypothetical protein